MIIMAIFAISAKSADTVDVTVGPLTYSPDPATLNCSVIKCDQSATEVVIPETITSNDNTYSVTSIGNEAFSGCTGLTDITIPESVTSIGNKAFSGCTGLTDITIPEAVTSIGAEAFYCCTGLTKVAYNAIECSGEGFYHYPYHWLRGCSNLKEVTIGESVKTLPDWIFFGCKGLTDITLSESVTSIGEEAFYSCFGLTEITIPEAVTSISGAAFTNCTGLTKVAIGKSVTSIGGFAFCSCFSLAEVSLPASLKSIGEYAFGYCSGLKNVILEDVNAWAKVEFENSESNPIYYARNFRQRDMNEPVHKLDLKNIDKVSDYAYINASNLQTVRFTGTEVGQSAFEGCDNVTDLCVDATKIDSKAFSGMNSLKNIYSMTATPPAAPDDAFSNYAGINLFVPQGALSAYENAENCWYRFLDASAGDFADVDSLFKADYTASIEEIASVEADLKVYTSDGCIHVEADSRDTVAIYTLQGNTIYIGTGSISFNVPAGAYIVRQGKNAAKVWVK